ncbi:MAG: AarF/UbiB family protein, partial [Actinomycetales bacterium]
MYRAVWGDGRDVAVKVQIPGITQALIADVRALSRVLRVSALLAPGVAMPPLVHELQMRVLAELDYQREAATQRSFARAYRGDRDFLIPDVVHVAHQVLVTEWLPGQPLAAVATAGAREQRDRAGLLYQRFFLQSPARTGLLHTDPHPGNFRLTEDGRLGVLDFGSAMELPGGLPPTFGALIGALQSGEPAEVQRRLAEQGLMTRGSLRDVTKLMDYLAPFTEPARHEDFEFSREWLHQVFARAHDPRNPDFIVAMKLSLPAEQLFTHRVWLGIVGVLSGLGSHLPVAEELRAYLPGF